VNGIIFRHVKNLSSRSWWNNWRSLDTRTCVYKAARMGINFLPSRKMPLVCVVYQWDSCLRASRAALEHREITY